MNLVVLSGEILEINPITQTKSGTSVINFKIETNDNGRRYIHKCTAFSNISHIISSDAIVGDRITIRGNIAYRTITKRIGSEEIFITMTDIVVDQVDIPEYYDAENECENNYE